VRGIVGICGTPGTGKKTIAPKVATLLGFPAAISINSFAPKAAVDVDTRHLRAGLVRSKPSRVVLFGHLLPDVLRKQEAAFVAVLRCDPSALRKRLAERGYPPAKVMANVEAELIGVLLYECVVQYGSQLVREYDTTSSSPEDVAKAIARDAKAALEGRVKTAAKRPTAWIDWTLDYGSSSKLRSLLGRSAPPAST
jgi:broad-specificity NMP kinase